MPVDIGDMPGDVAGFVHWARKTIAAATSRAEPILPRIRRFIDPLPSVVSMGPSGRCDEPPANGIHGDLR